MDVITKNVSVQGGNRLLKLSLKQGEYLNIGDNIRVRFKICGTAVSGLLMRTLGYWASPVRRRAFRARMCSTRAGSSVTALFSASASEQASATVGVPLR